MRTEVSQSPASPYDAAQTPQEPPDPHLIQALGELLAKGRFAVLTGAGISTESGIPDYRGPETRRRARNPIRFADYLNNDLLRARYWMRSMLGWPRFAGASPNQAHLALAEFEAQGIAFGPITQNVDGLHQRAGSLSVIELHGSLHRVRCLNCGLIEPRSLLQARLVETNPWVLAHTAELGPDGDADLESEREWLERFVIPTCLRCGGVLKPDVVFFGENVPHERVEQAYKRIEQASALLVVGTSLAVFSGYRFVRRAWERSIPIA
ncbi:MAG: NAD-dependent protein deacetylase, partial [Sandaracinaceae bacterium]|nr:NAD-dependent protein deacetylase [Sandaracinaceae bacterium]